MIHTLLCHSCQVCYLCWHVEHLSINDLIPVGPVKKVCMIWFTCFDTWLSCFFVILLGVNAIVSRHYIYICVYIYFVTVLAIDLFHQLNGKHFYICHLFFYIFGNIILINEKLSMICHHYIYGYTWSPNVGFTTVIVFDL